MKVKAYTSKVYTLCTILHSLIKVFFYTNPIVVQIGTDICILAI